MRPSFDILIVGGGIFGLPAALELKARGHHVALLDQGPIPHPLAASTDISKVVRMEYGRDESYMQMGEVARAGWLAWNEQFGRALYHEAGVLMLSRAPLAAGGYEHESYQMLLRRGHRPERLDSAEIGRRYPAWNNHVYVDGFFHALGGWVESGEVITALAREAGRRGIALLPGRKVTALAEVRGRVEGVRLEDGERVSAGLIVVAAGTWTQLLVPELAPVMRSIGQPVFHLRAPGRPQRLNFEPPAFPVFTADVANTGWYGFPIHPKENVLKVSNHGPGQRLHPERDPRLVTADDEQALRRFLAETFPSLAAAPLVHTRRCLYCDTADEHFWVDHHPNRLGLVVASGGSGHAFKFGPILGGLIADVVERRPNRFAARFRWRDFEVQPAGEEAARWHGD
ncbi:MAG: FAD-dependent oxidoreductase [Candidatus Promineifilaceae bacterium]